MKAANAIHRKSKVDFFFEFVPQIVMMLCLFGWMDLLIIVKWCTDWTPIMDAGQGNPPSIISTMIAMFLNMGKIADTDSPIIGTRTTQPIISTFLLCIALICVPTMLLVKPLYLKSQMDKAHAVKPEIELTEQEKYRKLANEEEKS